MTVSLTYHLRMCPLKCYAVVSSLQQMNSLLLVCSVLAVLSVVVCIFKMFLVLKRSVYGTNMPFVKNEFTAKNLHMSSVPCFQFSLDL